MYNIVWLQSTIKIAIGYDDYIMIQMAVEREFGKSE